GDVDGRSAVNVRVGDEIRDDEVESAGVDACSQVGWDLDDDVGPAPHRDALADQCFERDFVQGERGRTGVHAADLQQVLDQGGEATGLGGDQTGGGPGVGGQVGRVFGQNATDRGNGGDRRA